MGIEITGKILSIFETKQISDKFTKREFVVELLDNPKYPQPVLFQMTGDRCARLDEFQVGDGVRLDFSLRGREWKSRDGEIKFFNSLDVWKVERHGKREPRPVATHSTTSTPTGGGNGVDDDIPFGVDDDIPFATADMGAEPSPIARVLR